MQIKYYNYQEWKKQCTKLGCDVGIAHSLAGNKALRHRYAYHPNGEVLGEFTHDKNGSWGYLVEDCNDELEK